MIIKICVGSSCHLKGSSEIVRLLTEEIQKRSLEDDITLAGSFCLGKCNRAGVTVQLDEEVHTGITPENIKDFFENNVLAGINKGE